MAADAKEPIVYRCNWCHLESVPNIPANVNEVELSV